jgi:hypothetical protein
MARSKLTTTTTMATTVTITMEHQNHIKSREKEIATGKLLIFVDSASVKGARICCLIRDSFRTEVFHLKISYIFPSSLLIWVMKTFEIRRQCE